MRQLLTYRIGDLHGSAILFIWWFVAIGWTTCRRCNLTILPEILQLSNLQVGCHRASRIFSWFSNSVRQYPRCVWNTHGTGKFQTPTTYDHDHASCSSTPYTLETPHAAQRPNCAAQGKHGRDHRQPTEEGTCRWKPRPVRYRGVTCVFRYCVFTLSDDGVGQWMQKPRNWQRLRYADM